MEHYSTPRAMKRIGDLFEKYRTRFKPPQASVEKECVAVIAEVAGFTVALDQVEYNVQTKVLSLRLPSMIKTELRFHQSHILAELEKRLGKNSCPKIFL